MKLYHSCTPVLYLDQLYHCTTPVLLQNWKIPLPLYPCTTVLSLYPCSTPVSLYYSCTHCSPVLHLYPLPLQENCTTPLYLYTCTTALLLYPSTPELTVNQCATTVLYVHTVIHTLYYPCTIPVLSKYYFCTPIPLYCSITHISKHFIPFGYPCTPVLFLHCFPSVLLLHTCNTPVPNL